MHIKERVSLGIKHFSWNWKSGLTVSLVAIPLSISLAIAGGATPTQGIITAIWACAIAGIFGGSNYNIMGPTGALSGLLATFVFLHGIESLPLLAVVVGGIVLVAWAFHVERYLIFIPANTIQGFTLGIAFIIGFNQFNFAFGLSNLTKHESFIGNLWESFLHVGQLSISTLVVFLVFLFFMFTVDKVLKKMSWLPILPAATVLAPIGIVLGYLATARIIPLSLQTLGSKYVDISPKLFLSFSFGDGLSRSFMISAITVALVAIIETMLSAKIADGMTGTKYHKRKELFGLALANIGSGLAGGIPATAALARTALNIKSGANHKTSAFVAAICVALISFVFLSFFKYIPLAVIAAILVTVAIRMIEREHFKRMWSIDRRSFMVAMIVAGLTIAIDPIFGILAGAILSLLIFLNTLSKGQFDLVFNDMDKGVVGVLSGHKIDQITKNSHTLVYSIKGHLTYIDSQAHISRFESNLNGYETIVLRLRELYFVDIDGIDALDEIIGIIQSRGKKVYIAGASKVILPMLCQSKQFKKLEKEGAVFGRTVDVLQELGFNVPN